MCQHKRRLWIVIAVACGCLGASHARAQMPSTDIWLADVKVVGSDLKVGTPENVIRRVGYDSQPYFLPDSRGFLYTRADESSSTDIYRFERASKRIVQVTKTAESEYSPTPLYKQNGAFCTVRVESDSTQRLWRFERDGSHPQVLFAAVDSVGYFAWLDPSTVAVFVLGTPPTLRTIDVDSGRETVVARDIGRGLYRIPRNGQLSLVVHDEKSDPPTFTFFAWEAEGVPLERLIAAQGGGQDAMWIDDVLVMADGGKFYASRPYVGPGWYEIADFAAYGIAGITRVVASPDHRAIAFVAAESP